MSHCSSNRRASRSVTSQKSERSMAVVVLSHHLLSAHPVAILIGSEEASGNSQSRGLSFDTHNSRFHSLSRMLQGRVISCEFESFEVLKQLITLFLMFSSHVSFQLLGVYVPNCGGKGGFDRRRCWDDEMKLFVSASRCKPLILCGDLNVAPEYHDVSHPKWFRFVATPTHQSLCKLSSQGK